MKQITELTEKQILALTADELDNMVKYKMAEGGIKILDYPVEPEYEQLPQKEVEGWKVKGIDNYFFNKEVAEQAGEILKRIKESMFSTESLNYDYNLSFVKKYADGNYSFNKIGEVEQVFFYTKETIASISDIVKKNKDLKSEYEVALKDYHEADNASSDIKVLVYGTFEDVHKKYLKMEEMKYQFLKYVKLADGNKKTAMQFLKNAYQIDEQTEYFVQDKEMPIVAECAK